MQSIIKEIKQKYLDELKAKKAEYETKKVSIAAQKFAEKKANIDSENQELDKALAAFIAEKQQKLNDEIAQKRQEVADKKANSESLARSTAEAEAEAEVSHAIKEFDIEIAAIEKELA